LCVAGTSDYKFTLAHRIKIVEEYHEYTPPVRVRGAVELLMSHVPREHLEGLRKVVLTNSARLLQSNKGKYDFYGKRQRLGELRGFYTGGYIYLVTDRILDCYHELSLMVPIVRTLVMAEILYHELGHHINRRDQPGYRENREEAADEWRDELLFAFFEKRYWYLVRVLRVYKKLLHPLFVRLFRRSPGGPTEADTV